MLNRPAEADTAHKTRLAPVLLMNNTIDICLERNPLVTSRVLDLFKRSGDAHVGQTLTRLASLAAAAHRHETTTQIRDRSLPTITEQAPEADSTGTAHQPRTDAGVIRTEANR